MVPLGVLILADSVLSYAAPLYAQNLFSNQFIVGLAISFSSAVGLLFDYFSKRILGRRGFSFFIKLTFILLIIFSYSLGLSLVYRYIFIFAMVVWGIHYETLAFSGFKFLKDNIEKQYYTFSWAFISMLRALVYGIGPLIATYLISTSFSLPAYVSGTFVLITFVLYLTLEKRKPHTKNQTEVIDTLQLDSTRKVEEVKIWFVLFKRIHPVWLLSLVLLIVDSGFWTIGILMAENMAKTAPIARLMIPVYMLPAVFAAPLSQAVCNKHGKKKTAIVCAFFAAIFLVLMGLVNRVEFIIGAIFIYSIFTSLSFPAIYATFEDFVKRLSTYDVDLIGLEQSSANFGYILGPMLAGFIAVKLTDQKVFLVFGILLALVSLTALITTPKKIKMPQSELSKMT